MIRFHRLCLYAFPLPGTAKVPPPQLEVKFLPVRKGGPAERQVVKVLEREVAERRFERGEICFAALHKGEVVSYCWLAQGEVGIEEMDLAVKTHPDEVYLYDAVTLKPWRGRGLYPALLGEMVAYASKGGFSRALIFVSSSNRSSRRGVMKAGFIEFQVVTCLKIFRLSFYWQSEAADNQRPVEFIRL